MHAGADISIIIDTRLQVTELRASLTTALAQATLDAVKPLPTVPVQLRYRCAITCDMHSAMMILESSKKKKKRGYRVCSSGYAATDTS
jgi:hypothetical protein